MLDIWLRYKEKSYPIVPIISHGKYIEKFYPTYEDIIEWSNSSYDIGLLLGRKTGHYALKLKHPFGTYLLERLANEPIKPTMRWSVDGFDYIIYKNLWPKSATKIWDLHDSLQILGDKNALPLPPFKEKDWIESSFDYISDGPKWLDIRIKTAPKVISRHTMPSMWTFDWIANNLLKQGRKDEDLHLSELYKAFLIDSHFDTNEKKYDTFELFIQAVRLNGFKVYDQHVKAILNWRRPAYSAYVSLVQFSNLTSISK